MIHDFQYQRRLGVALLGEGAHADPVGGDKSGLRGRKKGGERKKCDQYDDLYDGGLVQCLKTLSFIFF